MTYKKTCGTCRFFDDDPTKKHPDCDGACHLNPPIIVNNSRDQKVLMFTPTDHNSRDQQVLMFTPTDQDFWCGQWEPNSEEMITAIDGLLGAIFGTKNAASNESEQKAPEPEDSWERLEEDARNLVIDYWSCRDADCLDCPVKVEGKNPEQRHGTLSCSIAMAVDILARAKKLAGVTGDE